MERIQITENFYLDEFTRSQRAARLGQELEIEPGSELFLNIEHLCQTLMQPLRDHLGRPIHILSGWRPEWLNLAVGGAKTSDHISALADDFVVAGMSPLEVCRAAKKLGLPYKQLIHEFGRWVHISAPAIGDDPRREALTAYKDLVKGSLKTKYANGLHPVEFLTNGGK